MTKAERLELAGLVAPTVREADARLRRRRVKLTDADGNVVREVTADVVRDSMLARHALEVAVQPEVRPEWFTCTHCGKHTRTPVRGRGNPPKRCENCRAVRCVDCGARMHASRLSPSAKSTCPARCMACRRKEAAAKVPLRCSECGKQLSKDSRFPSYAKRRTWSPRCHACTQALRRKPVAPKPERPAEVQCKDCGRVLKVGARGPIPTKCYGYSGCNRSIANQKAIERARRKRVSVDSNRT